MFGSVAATSPPTLPQEDTVHYIDVETAWQLRNERRDRFMAAAARRRRLRPQPPVDHLPDPAGPGRAA